MEDGPATGEGAPPDGGCDFVVFGTTGFLGSYILKALQACPEPPQQPHKVVVVPRSLRLHESRAELKSYLKACLPIRCGVICAAGTRGAPNIDWCKDHPGETVDANVVGQLNVCSVCRELSDESAKLLEGRDKQLIHVTLIGSGMAHNPFRNAGAEPIPDDSRCELHEGQHIYMRLRCLLEELLTAGSYTSSHVLNLRILFPICQDLSDKRGLLGKLLGFSRIDRVANSCTFLEELCPLIPTLVERRVVGHMNFTNPGTVRYDRAAELMKDMLKRKLESEARGCEEGDAVAPSKKANRRNPVPEALRGYAPAFRDVAGAEGGSRGTLHLGTEMLQQAVSPHVVRSAQQALQDTLEHAYF